MQETVKKKNDIEIKEDKIFDTKLAYDNWKSKYQYGDESPIDTQKRVAKALASVEDDPDHWYPIFLKTLVNIDEEGNAIGLKTTPGGRITANAGTKYEKASMFNCYINGPVKNATIEYQRDIPGSDKKIDVRYDTPDTGDNMYNIILSLMEQAKTLGFEGGWGINMSFIRPRASVIKGIGIEHPGVVKFLEVFDKMAEVIVAGNNDGYEGEIQNYLTDDEIQQIRDMYDGPIKKMARKGAMLVSLDVSHPDIEEFITAKQEAGRLTKFNVSVMMTDEFMEAVKNDDYFELKFEGTTYKRVKAKDLYDLIMKSTYNRAEPGVLFYDNMQKNNPISYMSEINATNPSLRHNTSVLTDKGVYPIKELAEHNDTIKVLNKNKEWKEAEAFKSGEDKQLYKITFLDGDFIYCTGEHKWPIVKTRRKENEFGSRVLEDRELDFNNLEKVETKDLKPRTKLYKPVNENPFKNPNCHHDHRDGFMTGWLEGDGWKIYHSNNESTQIGFITSHDEINIKDIIFEEVNNRSKRKVNFRESTKGKSYELVSTDDNVIDWVEDDLGFKEKNKVPETVWKGNTEFVKGYIDGLFSSDGYVDHERNRIVLTTKSKEFSDEVKQLLAYFGISCRVNHQETSNVKFPNGVDYNKTYHRYNLAIHGSQAKIFSKLFTLTSKDKQEKLNKIKNNDDIDESRYYYKIIDSIEPTDIYEDVYDITVFDSTSTFICQNGVVTGNCGEVGGSPHTTTVCLLGSLNLTQYVNDDRTFDYEKYREDVQVFARMLDNINDLQKEDLPPYLWAIKNVRQYGMGINGLGSTLYMMGVKYNSDEGIKFAENVNRIKMNETMRTSALLAEEKGAAEMFDEEKYFETYYWKEFINGKIDNDVVELVKKNGVRNLKHTTNPPLGNSGVICDMVSNSLEPVFLPFYERTYIADKWPKGLNKNNVKEKLEEVDAGGGAKAWQGEYDGIFYYYEPHNRGLCITETVYDYGYNWVRENYPEDIENNTDYLVSINDLSVKDHVAMQEAFQKYVDQSVSKTSNIPKDYPFEDFKDLYFDAWERGLNGFTTYREGTMEAVLKQKKDENEDKREGKIVKTNAPERPKTLECDVYHATAKGKNWVVIVGLLDGDPYEVFGLAEKKVKLPKTWKKGQLIKVKKGQYNLEFPEKEFVLEDVTDHFERDEEEALTRLVSTSLRHGTDVKFIVEQLKKSEGTIVSYSKAIARTLNRYVSEEDLQNMDGELGQEDCPEGGKHELIFEAGCTRCKKCNESRCGG